MKKRVLLNVKIGIFTAIIMLFASGCENNNKEELLEEFRSSHTPDYTYDLSETYETKEEFYKEILNLAKWDHEKNREIEHVFMREDDYDSEDISFIEEETDLDRLDQNFSGMRDSFYYKEKIVEMEREMYAEQEQMVRSHFKELRMRTNPEVLIYEERVYEDLVSRFNDIRRAEEFRQEGDSNWFFQELEKNVDYDIFYTLYPEELIAAMKKRMDTAPTMQFLEPVERFLREYWEGTEYDEAFAKRKAEVELANRCQYEGCENEYDVLVNKKKYCYEHRKILYGGKNIGSSKPGHSSGSSRGYNGSSTVKDDPYDVYDYSDAEDFYYDNYDDFYDYEDAEDYYEAWE